MITEIPDGYEAQARFEITTVPVACLYANYERYLMSVEIRDLQTGRTLHAWLCCPTVNPWQWYSAMAKVVQSYMSTTRGLIGSTAENPCKGCGQELTLCNHCSGSDGYCDAGQAQGGYYLCDDEECPEFEFCCGC